MQNPADIFPIHLPVEFVRDSVFGKDGAGDFGRIWAANREIVIHHRITDLQPGLTEARVARGEFIATAINNHDALFRALRMVLPLAESRVEDMLESDEANKEDGIAFDPSLSAKAVADVDAKALLAGLGVRMYAND